MDRWLVYMKVGFLIGWFKGGIYAVLGVFTLFGITSWGQHCGYANKPGVYVKVGYYRDWIEEKMRQYA